MVGRLLDERAWGEQFGIVMVDSERDRNKKCDRPSGSQKAGLDTYLPTYLPTSSRYREVGR